MKDNMAAPRQVCGRVVLLLLLVALLACVGGVASASPGDTVLFAEGTESEAYVFSMASVGDTLYMQLRDGVYAYQPQAGGEPERVYAVEEDAPLSSQYHLVSDGESLYLLSMEAQTLSRFDGGAWVDPQAVPFTDALSSEDGFSAVIQSVMDGDALLLLVQDYDNAAGMAGTILYRIPLGEGSVQALTQVDLYTMDLYAPGQLIGAANNPSATGGQDAIEWVVVNSQTGAEQEKLGYVANGTGYDITLAYDRTGGALYSHAGSVIERMGPDGSSIVVNYLAERSYFGDGALVGGGYYALKSMTGVYIRNIDETQLSATPLVIHGNLYDDDLVKAFGNAYPDIPVILKEGGMSSTEIADQLLSGASDVDIYVISSMNNTLLEKGYLADLSGSAALGQAVDRMYPQVQESVRWDGKLYAFPVAMWTSQWTVREDLLEAYGLSMPETYLEYVQMYMDWYESDAVYETDIMFTRDFGIRVDLLYSLLEQYEMAYAVPGEPLTFDQPVLREGIEMILSLAPGEYEELEEGIRYYYSSGSDNVIFDTWGGMILMNPASYSSSEGPYLVTAPPRLASDTERLLPATLDLLTISPNSKNQENAMVFLEFAIEHNQVDMRYLFYPDLNEPVLNSFYETQQEEVAAALAELNERLESASAEEHGAIEDEILSAESYVKYLETAQWLISKESIENYRALAPMLYIQRGSQLAMVASDSPQDNPVRLILQQLLSGQMAVEKAIQELNGKVRMVFLEAQ